MKRAKEFITPIAALFLMIILAICALTVQALADEISPAASDEMPFYIGAARYATLQEAIDAAAYGDTISITSKTVMLDGELEINGHKDITFTAVGDAAASGVTIFSAEGARHILIYYYANRSSNIKLKFIGVTLDGGDISGGITSSADVLTLDGAVIQNCNSFASGGAIIANRGTNTMIGCKIINNTAINITYPVGSQGGGIYIYNGSLEIRDSCVISGNSAGGSGGGVYHSRSKDTDENFVIISNSTISGNDAYYGGGICCDSGGDITVTNSVINDNTAIAGGGIYNSSGTFTIENNSLICGNTAQAGGGGLYIREDTEISIANSSVIGNSSMGSLGGGMVLTGHTKGTVTDCTISNNMAVTGKGGGINIFSSNIELENSVINNNVADKGGGIHVEAGGNSEIWNCVISDNEAEVGGGIHYDGNSGTALLIGDGSVVSNNVSNSYGGGISVHSFGSAIISDSTISGNQAGSAGGGININSSTDNTIKNCTISENISKRDGGGISIFYYSAATIDNCIISGNTAVNTGGGIYTQAYKNTDHLSGDIVDSIISDNIAGVSGGGIFVENTRFEILNINSGTKFYGNSAAVLYEPPQDADTLYPNIKYASISPPIFDHPLNNYDISYTSSTPYYHMIFDAGPGGEVTTGTNGFYAEGSEVEIEAEAFEGFVFGRWGIDTVEEVDTDNSFADILSANTNVTVPSCNATVTAYFLELDYDNHFAYIIGYPDGNIKPSSNITRAETATIFFRLLTLDSRALLWSQTNEYKDVVSTDWHNNAVSTLTYGGILTGDPDKNFRPNSNITRGELAAIAARFSSAKYDGEDLFDDIEGHWAAKYINIAASQGWVEGYGDRIYSPDRYITRAEVATLVNRVLRRLPESADDLHGDMQIWPDNMDTTKWYYIAIQEATNSHNYERKADGIYEAWISMREAPDWHKLQNPDSKPGDVSY